MEAVGNRIQMAIARSKRRTVFRECTIYEYIAESYDENGNKYTYWKCYDDQGNELTFDWNDILQNRVLFI
jgi:hypothetical protein